MATFPWDTLPWEQFRLGAINRLKNDSVLGMDDFELARMVFLQACQLKGAITPFGV